MDTFKTNLANQMDRLHTRRNFVLFNKDEFAEGIPIQGSGIFFLTFVIFCAPILALA